MHSMSTMNMGSDDNMSMEDMSISDGKASQYDRLSDCASISNELTRTI